MLNISADILRLVMEEKSYNVIRRMKFVGSKYSGLSTNTLNSFVQTPPIHEKGGVTPHRGGTRVLRPVPAITGVIAFNEIIANSCSSVKKRCDNAKRRKQDNGAPWASRPTI